jgi:hypothetical protein
VYYRRAASCCAFLWARGPNAKDIHKENFPAYDGKYLSYKAVHNSVEKRGKIFSDDEEIETELRKWLRQQSKYFYAAGFDGMVKQWDKNISMLVEDMSRNRCFSWFEYNIFLFYIHL